MKEDCTEIFFKHLFFKVIPSDKLFLKNKIPKIDIIK